MLEPGLQSPRILTLISPNLELLNVFKLPVCRTKGKLLPVGRLCLLTFHALESPPGRAPVLHTVQRLPRGLCVDRLPPPLPGQGLSDCAQLPGHEQDLQTLRRAVVEGWAARGGGFCSLPPSLPPSPLPYSKGFHTLFYPDDIFYGQEVAPFYR